jgi:hypothetical protein
MTTPPTLVVTPQTGAAISATEQASRDALQRLAETGSVLPAGAAPPPAPATPVHRIPAGDPDSRGGQFSADPVRNLPDPNAPAPAAPADPAAPAPPAGQAPPGSPAAPAEGQAAPAAGEAAGEAQADDGTITFALPDGTELALAAETPEDAERLSVLAELAEVGRDAEQMAAAVEAARALAEVDPAGFMLSHLVQMPPEQRIEEAEHLVLYLLSRPSVREALGPKVAKLLNDPNEARIVMAEQNTLRTTRASESQAAIAADREEQQNFRQVQASVDALLPADLAPDVARTIRMDMLRDIKGYAERYRLRTVPVTDLPAILAGRLGYLQIDATEAARRIQAATRSQLASRRVVARATTARPAAAHAPGAAPAPVTPRPATPRTGTAFVTGQARRQIAGRVPGPGAGSPTVPGTLETLTKNADGTTVGVDEAIRRHRALVAAGQRSY